MSDMENLVKLDGYIEKTVPEGRSRGRIAYRCEGCNKAQWSAGRIRRLFGQGLPLGWKKYREGVYCKGCLVLIDNHERIAGEPP